MQRHERLRSDHRAPADAASEAHRSVARADVAHPRQARSSGAEDCRRSSMSPAPTARARPSPSCARCWRRRASSVHVYTSPHLVRFNERFRLGAPDGGKLVSDEALADVLEECERANGGEPITVFEIETAAAFLLFSRHPADVTAARSRPRRPARRHQRDRQAARLRDHAGVDGSSRISRRHHREDRRREGRASSSATCRRRSRRSPTRCSTVIEQAGRARARAAARRPASTGACTASAAGWSIRTTTDCSICRCRSSSAAISSRTRAPPSRRCAPPVWRCRCRRSRPGIARAEWPARMQRLTQGRLKALAPPEQRAVARRRPQRRRRPRRCGGARRPRGARAAPAGADRRHAVDQGQRGLPAQFRRARAPRHCRADPAPGEERAGGSAGRHRARASAFRRRAATRSKRRSARWRGSISRPRRAS